MQIVIKLHQNSFYKQLQNFICVLLKNRPRTLVAEYFIVLEGSEQSICSGHQWLQLLLCEFAAVLVLKSDDPQIVSADG